MNTCRSRISIAALILLSSIGPCAFGQYVIGVPIGFPPGTAPLVRIDPLTGAYTTIATSGNSYQALAQNVAGQIYAGSFSTTAENGRISRINPMTGATLQTFNAVTPGAGDIRGLSFEASGKLFAVVNRNDAQGSPTLPDDLYEIHLASQTTSRIGSLGFLGVQGLDASPGGGLFAWDVQDGLLTVNPVTGAATDVNSSIGGTAQIQSIVFAPDGRLFGAGATLYGINPTTGAFSQIGAGGGPDVRGIEWIVPEPSAATLIATAVSLVAFTCRRATAFIAHARLIATEASAGF
jgi:hypothetical protein